jgi:hypothetical protein
MHFDFEDGLTPWRSLPTKVRMIPFGTAVESSQEKYAISRMAMAIKLLENGHDSDDGSSYLRNCLDLGQLRIDACSSAFHAPAFNASC